MDYNPSVVYTLTLADTLNKLQPKWLSKDVLFLFYTEAEYSLAVREFLDAYYGVDGDGFPLGGMIKSDARI